MFKLSGISLDFLEMNPKYEAEGGKVTLNVQPEDVIVLPQD